MSMHPIPILICPPPPPPPPPPTCALSAEYVYCKQLLALEKQSTSPRCNLPEEACAIQTPLKLKAWQELLKQHPDQEFTSYILRGIEFGFRIGFNDDSVSLRSRGQNMKSAQEYPQVVTRYLQDEAQQSRIVDIGSTEAAQSLNIHCSPFGVIPKKNKPNKWRLIIDLSSPENHSVNDGILKELASLSYMSIDDVVSTVLKMGKGTMLAKMDVQQAFRNIPVHPSDRGLLGMQWEGRVFLDKVLPFGLRSAPLLFSAVADALAWIMHQRGVGWLDHYIDDFVTAGAPNSDECQENVHSMKAVCAETGIPLDPGKDEGPATMISVLGVEVDTVAMVVRLPPGKLSHLKSELASWRTKKICRKRELLSLIGSLSHACKAVRAGRTFLRRMIDLSTTVRRLDRHVRLTISARSDIEWWFQYCSCWNGISMMSSVSRAKPDVTMLSDASGNWGCGALSGLDWFQLQWAGPIKDYHITVKELVPIVLAAALWGPKWKGKTVRARCDNAAVVSIINSGSSRVQEAMHLMRCLAFLAAKDEFYIFATHIRGVDNTLADALSRNNGSLFRTLHPQAKQSPTPIPVSLLDLLIVTKPDWLSQHWTQLWSSTFAMV